MPVLTIELTEELRRRAGARAAEGGYARVEDYLRALIADDTGGPVSEEIEEKLLAALKSPGRIMTRADWEAEKQKLIERHGANKV